VDARTFLGTLRIPGLWLFGEEDNSVPTRKSIRVLDSLATAGHPYEWRLYQGYGHALIGRGDGQLTPQSAPIAMRDIIVWLEGATR
jgi:hypothetical protein